MSAISGKPVHCLTLSPIRRMFHAIQACLCGLRKASGTPIAVTGDASAVASSATVKSGYTVLDAVSGLADTVKAVAQIAMNQCGSLSDDVSQSVSNQSNIHDYPYLWNRLLTGNPQAEAVKDSCQNLVCMAINIHDFVNEFLSRELNDTGMSPKKSALVQYLADLSALAEHTYQAVQSLEVVNSNLPNIFLSIQRTVDAMKCTVDAKSFELETKIKGLSDETNSSLCNLKGVEGSSNHLYAAVSAAATTVVAIAGSTAKVIESFRPLDLKKANETLWSHIVARFSFYRNVESDLDRSAQEEGLRKEQAVLQSQENVNMAKALDTLNKVIDFLKPNNEYSQMKTVEEDFSWSIFLKDLKKEGFNWDIFLEDLKKLPCLEATSLPNALEAAVNTYTQLANPQQHH